VSWPDPRGVLAVKNRRLLLALCILIPALPGCTSARCLGAVQTHLTLGTAYLNEGDCKAATREFFAAESACPAAAREPEIQHRLGLSFLCTEMFLEAEERLLLALGLTAEPFPQVLVNLSALYIAQEEWEQAEASAREALEDPSYTEAGRAWVNLAFAAFQQGKLGVADEAYRTVLSKSPEFCPAWFGLAQLAETREDLDGALEHYRTASECADRDLQYRYELGRVLNLLGHLDEARGLLQGVVDSTGDPALAARAEDLLSTMP
jgi:Tfp pilus assembly protein PilF